MDEEISYDAACTLERIGKSTSFQELVLIPNQSRLPKFVSIAITCYVKHEFYKQHNEWTKGLVSEFDDPPLALPCVAEENLFDENVDPTSHRHLFSALAQVEDDPEFRRKLAALIIRNARMAVLGHQVSMEEEEEEDKVRILCNIRKLHEVTFVMFGQEESDDNLGMLPTDVRALNLLEAVELEADDDCNEEEEEDCCTICLEQLISASCIDAAAAARMPCGHLFHDGCIRKWLAQSHYCPICRFEMPKAGSES